MKHFSVLAMFFVASVATAQDMPLHEILKPGETWQPASGDMPKVDDWSVFLRFLRDRTDGPKLHEPTCLTISLGGSTVLVADAADRYVWAFQIKKDNTLGPGDRYCRLRVRGDDRWKKDTPPEAYRADPSAMSVDGANRTYVATNLGIQVFDPTGRLCGVITAPPGRVTEMAFRGDRLFARAGDKVYMRQMLAEGPR
jgi:SMP-30/gluconolaconase/LRE-like protein